MEVGEEAAQVSEKLTSLGGKACEAEGLSMLNLEMIGVETTLYGYCNVEFQKIGKIPLPAGMKVGDEVDIVSGRPDSEPVFGLIKKLTPLTVTVVIQEYDDQVAEVPIRLNLHPSMKTHEKMVEALDFLQAHPHPLADMIHSPSSYDPRSVTLLSPTEQGKVSHWFNSGLNDSQQQAIHTALRATKIALIHGPVSLCSGNCSFIINMTLNNIVSARHR